MVKVPVQEGLPPLPRARLKLLARLGTRTGRERERLYVLEGRRAIEDALERGERLRFVVATPDAEGILREWVAGGRLPEGAAPFGISAAEIEHATDTRTPQGLLAVGDVPDLSLAALPEDGGRILLLVDGVQNPGNLGTLLRTLAAVGGRSAILCRGTVDPYNPKAVRGAAGLTPTLSIAAPVAAAEAVEWCAARSRPIVLLEAGAPDLFEARLPEGPLALAVGSEARGVTPEVSGAASLRVGLPMSGPVESLSVAVAGSIALYALALGLRGARR
ncbi:MAG TPA: RNA methyltransferase [Gemmatimonadota bacterium]|jgi:TrmH family RNA methyltransferase|nr:RNA methyltransferase [Gemmatimonadota bacterium]